MAALGPNMNTQNHIQQANDFEEDGDDEYFDEDENDDELDDEDENDDKLEDDEK